MTNHSQQILSLIEDSQDFTTLDNHFNRFNPFKILQVDNYEIRHSNVLMWLLDPRQNHNLGSYFIKKLLAKVFVNPANYEDEDKLSNYNVLELCSHSYHDLAVYKELATSNRKRIDVLAVSAVHKTVVLIENKYWASESEGQLEEYIEFARSTYEGYRIVPIFLTLLDEEPTHEDYLMVGYSDVLGILQNLLSSQVNYMNSHVHSFLSYYVDILEDQLVQNEELNEIGMALYKNHKEAVDFLYQHGQAVNFREVEDSDAVLHTYVRHKETIDFIKKVGDSLLKEAFLRFARKMNWPEHLITAHFRVPHFLEQSWYDHFEEEDLRKPWWMNRGLIAWFERADDRMKLRVEVGPLEHGKRVKLLKALQVKGIDVREQAFEEGRQYTRIYMDAECPASWDDVDSLIQTMERLYEKEAFQVVLKQIAEALHMDTEQEPAALPMPEAPLAKAFQSFAVEQHIQPDHFFVHPSLPCFIEPEWTKFPTDYEVTERYWLGHPLIAWFSRRSTAVRLIVEVGPLPSEKRNAFLQRLEEQGIPVRALAYEEGRKYTRIYSRAVTVENLEDAAELKGAMGQLVRSHEFEMLRGQVQRAIEKLI